MRPISWTFVDNCTSVYIFEGHVPVHAKFSSFSNTRECPNMQFRVVRINVASSTLVVAPCV